MYSSTTDPATHMTTHVRYEPTCLENLLMSEAVRFWVGCAIIAIAPWVLLLEQPATTMEGWDEDDFKF